MSTNPFRYFKTSPEIIRLAVMLYVRFPLSLRNVEDLLHERGIDVSHETVRYWWNRFGPIFAAEIRRKRARHLRGWPQWRWHLDEVFVRINGKIHYLWCAVDHEGEVQHCQINFKAPALDEEGAQLCSTELTPLGKSGGAVQLEIFAAVEMTLLIEMIVYG